MMLSCSLYEMFLCDGSTSTTEKQSLLVFDIHAAIGAGAGVVAANSGLQLQLTGVSVRRCVAYCRKAGKFLTKLHHSNPRSREHGLQLGNASQRLVISIERATNIHLTRPSRFSTVLAAGLSLSHTFTIQL